MIPIYTLFSINKPHKSGDQMLEFNQAYRASPTKVGINILIQCALNFRKALRNCRDECLSLVRPIFLVY